MTADLCADLPADWHRIDLTDVAGWPTGPIGGALRAAHRMGVVLWAGQRQGSGRLDDPASLLGLTLTLVRGMAAPTPPPHACSFPFADPRLRGYLVVGRELNSALPGADRPVSSYLVQIVASAAEVDLVAVLCVVTHDPDRYAEAAVVAARVARSFRLAQANTSEP